MLFRLPRRVARRGVRWRAVVPDRYVTDGRRLFRVTSRLDIDRQCLVALEDCVTLEVKAYAPNELGVMGLQLVGTAEPVQQASDDSAGICKTGQRVSALSSASGP